jgi:hypothetical protein
LVSEPSMTPMNEIDDLRYALVSQKKARHNTVDIFARKHSQKAHEDAW